MMMRVGLPKNKNLKKSVPDFLAACGVAIAPAEDRKDYTAISGDGFDGVACSLKQDTLIRWVAEGRLQAGIVGLDCATEFNLAAAAASGADGDAPRVEVAGALGIGECSLKIAVSNRMNVSDVRDLQGMRFATSFPNILRAFLAENGVEAGEIVEMDGSVEMAIALGEADAIMDLVETGASLRANNLKAVFDVMAVEAVVIRPVQMNTPAVRALVSRLVGAASDAEPKDNSAARSQDSADRPAVMRPLVARVA